MIMYWQQLRDKSADLPRNPKKDSRHSWIQVIKTFRK